jgi:DNA repair exonuclease SbcCD ATPase subunit
MRLFIIVCSLLLIIGAAVEISSLEGQPAEFLARALSQPLPQAAASMAILFAALGLLAAALWTVEKLRQVRKTNEALEARLRGVHATIDNLESSQKDAESAVNYLGRSDPDQTITALQQRLVNAERAAQLHQDHDQTSDLLARVEDLQGKQKAFREMLAETFEKRRSIERLFADLQQSQEDIDQMVRDLESGDGSLQGRLQKLSQSISEIDPRLDSIEHSMQTLTELKKSLGVLQSRLAPLEHNEHGGVRNFVKTVYELRDQLAARVDVLDHEGGIALADRVAELSQTKQVLDASVANLLQQFSSLETIHKEMSGLFAKLGNAIDVHALANGNQRVSR